MMRVWSMRGLLGFVSLLRGRIKLSKGLNGWEKYLKGISGGIRQILSQHEEVWKKRMMSGGMLIGCRTRRYWGYGCRRSSCGCDRGIRSDEGIFVLVVAFNAGY